MHEMEMEATQGGSVKRYNVVSSDHCTGTEMQAREDGRFVMYSDALAAIEQARKEEREACAALAELCDDADHAARAIRARKP